MQNCMAREYIFLRLDKVRPREGTEVKTDFTFREKVFLSEIVGCLTERSGCHPERSEGGQQSEVRQRSEVRQSF